MFRCPITGRVSKPGDKPINVILEKRMREYWDTDDGKAPKRAFNPLDGDRMYHVIGTGWEVMRETNVSKDGFEQLKSEGKIAA